jgi:hypothetical protein
MPKPKPDRQPRKAKPKSREVVLPFLENASDEQKRDALAKAVPDWDRLDKDEQAELQRLVKALRARGKPVKMRLVAKPSGGYTIEAADKETLAILKLHNLFSAASMDSVNARASELLNYLASIGANSDSRYNAALAFIEGMAPQSEAEALLLVQMYCTHDAAIRALSQLGKAEWVPTAQTFGNLATKLLRTSQGQMETLARLRRGGEQVVRHIHVDNRGGQAVIAEQFHGPAGGPVNGKNEDQCHAPGNSAAGASPALPGPDPIGQAVPIPSRERQATVPDARRD